MTAAVLSKVFRLLAPGVFAAALLAGCGGGGGGDGGGGGGGGGGSGPYTIGGSITGLSGTVVLQINGGETVSRSATGAFTFPTSLASGTAYTVTVQTQPASQNCVLTNATGNATANITNVTVACAVKTYTVGGTVNGLSGSLVLAESNEEYSALVTASGNWQFTGKIDHGDPYAVSVYKQPLGQTCAVTVGSGTNTTANVSNVVVNCVNNPYTVSGTVSGLTSGTMDLQLNLAGNLTVGNGSFTFPKALPAGAAYVVSIVASTQTTHACTVANPLGQANANVTNVAFTCTPLPANIPIGGNVLGLPSGAPVTLRNSVNNETVTVTGNSTTNPVGFAFPTAVARNTDFVISVQTQPVGMICSIGGAFGTVAANSPSALRIVCAPGTETHTVGGSVTGLKAPLKLAISLSNAVLDINPGSGTGAVSYTFPVPLQYDTEFSVAVRQQPTGQVCQIPHGGSFVGHANITDIVVTCVDDVTDLLSGTYTSSGGDFALSLYGNGIYVFASVDDDPACGASKGSGVETGAYRYNAAAGTLTFISNVLDTNGSAPGCGVWQNGASIVSGAFTKTGSAQDTVLTITTTDGTPAFPLVPVPSVASRPVGSFFVLGSTSFVVFGPDGRYLEANANDDPASGAPAGVEYGCYTATGVNTGNLGATVNTATCPGAVNTDGSAGLSDLGSATMQFNTGPGFLVFNSGETVLLRVLPN